MTEPKLRNPRYDGAFLVAIGLALCKFSIFDALVSAQSQEPTVHFSTRWCAFTLIPVLYGLYLLILGPAGAKHTYSSPGTRRIPPMGYVVFTVLGLACLGVAFGLRGYLQTLGYIFKGV